MPLPVVPLTIVRGAVLPHPPEAMRIIIFLAMH
jgi:hypothetical protein